MRTKRTVRSSKALQRRRRRRTRSSSSLPHFFPIPECSSRTATALGQLVHYANIFTLEREREESPHSFIHSSLSSVHNSSIPCLSVCLSCNNNLSCVHIVVYECPIPALLPPFIHSFIFGVHSQKINASLLLRNAVAPTTGRLQFLR